VVAIMAIIMGALGYSISNMGGPATQVAASQVASGMSLARQYAVARNRETRFVICNLDGASGDGLPPESWRYWTVIQTNRGSNNWTMLKEWEKLPGGVVFLNVAVAGYSPIGGDPMDGVKLGEPFAPDFRDNASPGREWQFIQSPTNNLPVLVNGKRFKLGNTACIGFRGDGGAVKGDGRAMGSAVGSSVAEEAIRVARGVATPDHKIILKSTNDYYYIETDKRGRVRVRSPESFRN